MNKLLPPLLISGLLAASTTSAHAGRDGYWKEPNITKVEVLFENNVQENLNFCPPGAIALVYGNHLHRIHTVKLGDELGDLNPVPFDTLSPNQIEVCLGDVDPADYVLKFVSGKYRHGYKYISELVTVGAVGPVGPPGPPGPPGASGLALYYTESGPTPIPANGRLKVVARCNAGDLATGGGFDHQFATSVRVLRSQWLQVESGVTGPTGSGWTVEFINESNNPSPNVRVKVVCADLTP